MHHLLSDRKYAHDEGLITFTMKDDTFTISVDSLAKQGPIWYAERGVFVTDASDATTFDAYHTSRVALPDLSEIRFIADRLFVPVVPYAQLRAAGTAVDFSTIETPEKFLVRFRHPNKSPVKTVRVNGIEHGEFDPVKGDVDVTGMSGTVIVEAHY